MKNSPKLQKKNFTRLFQYNRQAFSSEVYKSWILNVSSTPYANDAIVKCTKTICVKFCLFMIFILIYVNECLYINIFNLWWFIEKEVSSIISWCVDGRQGFTNIKHLIFLPFAMRYFGYYRKFDEYYNFIILKD